MLPHDELLHYGVRGMRWGIRRSLNKASTLEIGSHELDNEARKIRSGAIKSGVLNGYIINKKYYNSEKKGAARREALASNFELAAKMDREQAKRLRAHAEVKAREVRMRADNKSREREIKRMQKARTKFAEKKSLDRPYNKRYEKKNSAKFEDAVTKIATGVTIGVVGRLLGPTADSFGQAMVGRVGRQVKRATSSAGTQAAVAEVVRQARPSSRENIRQAARATDDIFGYTLDPSSQF